MFFEYLVSKSRTFFTNNKKKFPGIRIWKPLITRLGRKTYLHAVFISDTKFKKKKMNLFYNTVKKKENLTLKSVMQSTLSFGNF